MVDEKLDKNHIQLYKNMIDRFGLDTQLVVLLEELSELQLVITRYLRGRYNKNDLINLCAEEIADVLIMIEQLLYALNFNNLVSDWKKLKIKRLGEMINFQYGTTE